MSTSRAVAGPAPDDDAARRFGLGALLSLLGLFLAAVPFGALLLLVRARWQPLMDLDWSLLASAYAAAVDSPVLLEVARRTTYLGDPIVTNALALIAAILLWRHGARRLAAYVLVARLGSIALSTGIKVTIERLRPVVEDPVSWAGGFSFPSGHALGTTATYAAVLLVALPLLSPTGRRLGWAAVIAVAVMVSASRVLLGVHYLSDVVGGMLIAAAWVCVCTAAFSVWQREQGRPPSSAAEGADPSATQLLETR